MGIILISIIALYYYITFKAKNYSNKGTIATSVTPIFIFLILVLMPYISGITQGYLENKYLKEDYKIVHSVDITLIPSEEILKDVYIIKKLNKGIIIRNFDQKENKATFEFINWNNISSIIYKRIDKLLSPF